jgi:hypothetical protein
VWIVLGLFAALLLGTVTASLFVSIFYSASRLASAAERVYSKRETSFIALASEQSLHH